MANGVFNIDQLANAIAQTLKEYSNVTQEQINDLAKSVAQKGAQKLRLATAGEFESRSGDYRRGWRAKKVKGKWIVHNATDYQLTHLLEKGHDIKDSKGRKVGDAKPFPHIEKVEQELIEEFEREIRELLGG